LARRTGPQGRDAPPLALPLQRAGDRACLDWACHPGAGGRHVILLHPATHSGAEVQHRLLIYRIIKEICNAARELARFPAPFSIVLPDLFVAGDGSSTTSPTRASCFSTTAATGRPSKSRPSGPRRSSPSSRAIEIGHILGRHQQSRRVIVREDWACTPKPPLAGRRSRPICY
jgi:hypothetical protein